MKNSNENSILVLNGEYFSSEEIRRLFKKYGNIINIKYEKVSRIYTIEFNDKITAENVYNLSSNSNGIPFKGKILNIFLNNNGNNNDNQNIIKNINIESLSENTGSEKSNKIINEEHYSLFFSNYKQLIKERLQQKNNFKKYSFFRNKIINFEVTSKLGDANMHFMKGELDDAIEKIKEVIKICPDLPETFHLLSLIFEAKNEKGKSLNMLMLFAQCIKNDKDLWLRCANLNEKYLNYSNAEYCYTRALRLNKDDEKIIINKAKVQEKMKNYFKCSMTYLKLYDPSLIYKVINENIIIHIINLLAKTQRFDILELIIQRLSLIPFNNCKRYKEYENKKISYFFENISSESFSVLNTNHEISKLFKTNLIFNKTIKYYEFLFTFCIINKLNNSEDIFRNEILTFSITNNTDFEFNTLIEIYCNINDKILISKLILFFLLIKLNNSYLSYFSSSLINNKESYDNNFSDIIRFIIFLKSKIIDNDIFLYYYNKICYILENNHLFYFSKKEELIRYFPNYCENINEKKNEEVSFINLLEEINNEFDQLIENDLRGYNYIKNENEEYNEENKRLLNRKRKKLSSIDKLSNEINILKNSLRDKKIIYQNLISFINKDISLNIFEEISLYKTIFIFESQFDSLKNKLFNYYLNSIVAKDVKNEELLNDNFIHEEKIFSFLKNKKQFFYSNENFSQDEYKRKKYIYILRMINKDITNIDNIEKYISMNDLFNHLLKFFLYILNLKHDEKINNEIGILINILLNKSHLDDKILIKVLIFGLLIFYKLKQYEKIFSILKRIISISHFSDIISKFSYFNWIFIWKTGQTSENVNLTRPIFYKMSKRINLKGINFLDLILAQCYLRTGSYSLSLNYLFSLIKIFPNSSLLLFCLSIVYIFLSLSRKNKNKEKTILIAKNHLEKYLTLKYEEGKFLEAYYNKGRFYQFIGINSIAENIYKIIYNNKFENTINDKIKMYSSYNSALISKKNGNIRKAHDKIINNIII